MAKDPIKKNRAFWTESSKGYQETHGDVLEATPLAWGVWRVPECRLGILGDVAGRDVLEIGCGAANWTLELKRRGARAIGIDLSHEQLRHGAERSRRLQTALTAVQGNAELLPFESGSFDIVFCDHGATSFTRPELTVAEAARVLRPGGLFAFCMSSPIRDLCCDEKTYDVTPALARDYFGMHELEDDETFCYQLPYGEWIRLFRRHALVVEDLVEIQAPADAGTTYTDYVSPAWARRWPAENIWKLRKTGDQAAEH